MTIKAINVHIKVKDFLKSLAFYESLGFQKEFQYGPNQDIKESYNGATFKHGSTLLEIADGHRGVKPHVFAEPVRSSKISLFIEVESISEMLGKCKQLGIEIAVSVRHYYWGKLEFVIKDPDGTVIVFFAPYTEEEAKKTQADATFGVNPNT